MFSSQLTLKSVVISDVFAGVHTAFAGDERDGARKGVPCICLPHPESLCAPADKVDRTTRRDHSYHCSPYDIT